MSVPTPVYFEPKVKVDAENLDQGNFKAPDLHNSSGFILTRKANRIKSLHLGTTDVISKLIFSRTLQQKTFLQVPGT
jgi:hypothetical protein